MAAKVTVKETKTYVLELDAELAHALQNCTISNINDGRVQTRLCRELTAAFTAAGIPQTSGFSR